MEDKRRLELLGTLGIMGDNSLFGAPLTVMAVMKRLTAPTPHVAALLS